MAADAPEQRTSVLEKLEREMGTCLQQLDRLGLHQAAAHVDMAMAQIRRSRWVRPGRPAFAPSERRRSETAPDA